MKIPAAILASLTIFLLAQPPVLTRKKGVVDNSCEKESSGCCQKKSCTPEKKDPGNCCDDMFCNPFGTCCSFLSTERPVAAGPPYQVQSKKFNPANDTVSSSYIHEVWNPPKLILSFID